MDWLKEISPQSSAHVRGSGVGGHTEGSPHTPRAGVGEESSLFPMTHSRIDPNVRLTHQGRSALGALAHAVHSRFFYADRALEADYLVYFVKDRLSAVILVGLATLGGVAGFGWSLQYPSRLAPQAVVLDLVALGMWMVALAACTFLYREATRLLNLSSEIDAVADDLVGAEAASPSSVPTRATRSTRRGAERVAVVAQLRRNAALHERFMMWCNAAFFVVAMSHYLTKGDCALPNDTPDRHYRCLNSIGLEAVVVLAYGLSVTIARSRTLLQAASMLACTLVYFFIQGFVSPATGRPDATTQQSFIVVVVVLAVLSIGTIFFVDRSERGHFQELRKLERHRDEAGRLANYCRSIASSVMPSSVVARLSRGVAVKDMVPAAAVCCVGLRHSAESFMQCSPHELVQVLQRFKSSLDAAGRRVDGLTKVHTMGDTHMVVAGEAAQPAGPAAKNGAADAAVPAEARALEAVLCFLWHFVMLRASEQASDTAGSERSYGSLLDSQSTVGDGRAVQAVAAVECGGVCLASIGSQCFVALGRTVRTAELLQRLAAQTLMPDERALIRLSTECAALLPHCPHRFPVLPDAAAASGGILSSTRIDAATWCPTSVQFSSAVNPLDANGWPWSIANIPIALSVIDTNLLFPQRGGDPQRRHLPKASADESHRLSVVSTISGCSTATNTADIIQKETQLERLSMASRFELVGRCLIASRFADDNVEEAFQQEVRATCDRGRTQWEFTCMQFVAASMLAVCIISGLHADGLAADAPLLWVAVANGCAALGLVVSTQCLNEGTTMVIRLLEVVFAVAYVLSCVLADARSILGSGDMLWYNIIIVCTALRERRQGLLFQCVLVLLLAIPFFNRVVEMYSDPIQGVLLIFINLIACFACFVLWDRFRREQYATSRAIELLEEEYLDDVGRLQRMLEVMIPSTVVGKLIDVVRGTLTSGGADFTTSVRGADLPRVKALTHNVWQSPFTTFTEDIPLLIARVFPSPSWGGDDGGDAFPGEINRTVAVLSRTQRAVLEVLRTCPTLCMVKMCGDTLMIAEQSAAEPTDKAALLGRAAVRVARELREAGISASVALVAGPLVGAVLGTTAITFEYYGHAASQGLALLEALPQGDVYASARFAALVRLAQSTTGQAAAAFSEVHVEWEAGIAVEASQRMQLRDVGRVHVHRVAISVS